MRNIHNKFALMGVSFLMFAQTLLNVDQYLPALIGIVGMILVVCSFFVKEK